MTKARTLADITIPSGTPVGTTDTQTLTNKTLTAPTIASANLTTALTLAGAAGTNGQVLTSAGSGLPSWTTVSAGYTLGTPVATTSGTAVDMTGIPSGIKQIILSFNAVKTSGTSRKLIQIGDSGGIETADYWSQSSRLKSATVESQLTNSAGFTLNSVVAANAIQGSVIFSLENATTNNWTIMGILGNQGVGEQYLLSGMKELSAVIDRLRITTEGGVDTFTAGEINISYI